jgi:hypothetical protein
MISKKTLEGIGESAERVLMIADENMQKIRSRKKLTRTSKADIKTSDYRIFMTIQTVAIVHKSLMTLNSSDT